MKGLTNAFLGIIFVMSSTAIAQQTHFDRLPQTTQDSVRLSEALDADIGEYPAPRVYNKWLHELSACENLPIDEAKAADIVYFVINSADFRVPATGKATYFALSNVHLDFMIVSLPKLYEEPFIKHEYLHYLLYWKFGMKYQDVGHQHPVEYYTKCNVRLGPFDK